MTFHAQVLNYISRMASLKRTNELIYLQIVSHKGKLMYQSLANGGTSSHAVKPPTLASGFTNPLLDLEMIVVKQEYTASSTSLSAKHAKFSCSLRRLFSLYESSDKQKERSLHCRSFLKE